MEEILKERRKKEVFEVYICEHLKLLLQSPNVGYKDLKGIQDIYDKIENYKKYAVEENKTDDEIISEVLEKFKVGRG